MYLIFFLFGLQCRWFLLLFSCALVQCDSCLFCNCENIKRYKEEKKTIRLFLCRFFSDILDSFLFSFDFPISDMNLLTTFGQVSFLVWTDNTHIHNGCTSRQWYTNTIEKRIKQTVLDRLKTTSRSFHKTKLTCLFRRDTTEDSFLYFSSSSLCMLNEKSICTGFRWWWWVVYWSWSRNEEKTRAWSIIIEFHFFSIDPVKIRWAWHYHHRRHRRIFIGLIQNAILSWLNVV